jgi:hypothetical protein
LRAEAAAKTYVIWIQVVAMVQLLAPLDASCSWTRAEEPLSVSIRSPVENRVAPEPAV